MHIGIEYHVIEVYIKGSVVKKGGGGFESGSGLNMLDISKRNNLERGLTSG